jgi:parvulin-like peptidyl-prolyl isomerase
MKNSIKVFVFAIFALFVCTSTSCLTSQAEEFCVVTSVKASHILVDSKEEADFIKSQIDSGVSFEALAKQYSKCPSGENGGSLGYFRRGQMVMPFEAAAFDLPVGKVSDPVRTQFGWHIIKVYAQK